MPELKPCPVCGKKPKLHYYSLNLGWAVCKPFLQKPHLETGAIYTWPSELKRTIIAEWNRMVTNDKTD